MDNKPDLPLFKPCKSQTNVVANGFIVSFFGGLGLLGLGMLGYAVFWLFTPDNEEVMVKVVIVIMMLILTGLVVFLLVYFRKSYGHTGILIDETGITYYYRDQKHIVKLLPWSTFLKNPDEKRRQDVYDVNEFVIGFKTRVKVLQWWVMKGGKVDKQSDHFGAGGHFFHFAYLNRLTLISTFLLGLAHFRPDLKINPSVFREFYIDPNEYAFKRKKYIRDVVIGIAVVVVAVVIYLCI